MAHWIGAKGQVTSAKKALKHASIVTSLIENPKSETKKDFFQSEMEDLPNPWRV